MLGFFSWFNHMSSLFYHLLLDILSLSVFLVQLKFRPFCSSPQFLSLSFLSLPLPLHSLFPVLSSPTPTLPEALSKQNLISLSSPLISPFFGNLINHYIQLKCCFRQISKHRSKPINPCCLSPWLGILWETNCVWSCSFFSEVCVCVIQMNTSYWSPLSCAYTAWQICKRK